ncbi:MAG: hypothetical protein L3J29_06860 [Cyclobacteriaceae bacterium]|nr:hypothetical protein [Cyclobacteriaceae bacterium]
MKTVHFFMVGLIIIGLQACGGESIKERAEEKVAEGILGSLTGTDIEIDSDGEDGKITIKGKDGEEFIFGGSETELPDDFPSDVYVIDGEIESVGIIKTNEGSIVTFQMYLTDDLSNLVKDIKKGMESKGWESNMTMGSGNESTTVYSKGEANTMIIFSKQDEKVLVSYNVTYK